MGGMPQKLNFVAFGTLSVLGKTCSGVHIGQGHTGSHNNWWFGSHDCESPSWSASSQLICGCGITVVGDTNSDVFHVHTHGQGDQEKVLFVEVNASVVGSENAPI